METRTSETPAAPRSVLAPALVHAASGPVWGLVMIVAASIILYGYSVWYPLGRDQAIFAYIADRISDGGLPYKDAWDFKSPGVYYVYRLAFVLFGRSEVAVRLFDMLAALATSVLIWHIFYRRKTGAVGVAAGILYGAVYGLSGYWCMAQTEGFAVFITALAANLLLADGWNRTGRLAMTGIALGAAFLMKFSFALVGLGFFLFAVLSSRDDRRLRTAIVLGAGFAVLPVLTAVYFMAHGALADAAAASLRFASKYQAYPPKTASDVLFDFATGALGRKTVYDVLILPFYICGFSFAASHLGREQSLGRVWILSSLAAVIVQLKFFPYHWIAMFGPAALLSGLAISRAAAAKSPDAGISRAMVSIVASLLIVRALLASATEWGFLLTPAKSNMLSPWLAQFSSEPGHGVSYASDLAAARYIKENTFPDDTVLVLGFEPLINFLSERRAPTRFVYMDAVTAPWTPPAWRREYMDDVRSNKPALIIIVHGDTHIWKTKDSAAMLQDWPELRSFVEQNYLPAGHVGNFDILRVSGR